ncbi:AbrB family transcriptional regulator [Aliigemmobacter aestuarii]|uniref:AbrB family transcriptional regulator n=1 Tax=Aliigemmobacter aestuarii TaxID=1445661 RepID=A0A4S3MLY4_9RHOB|nr:AbrB family transcriptional regulator [Gemmobacter aestuarii]THD83416.1 AbrB family transcriptional regulator [Gemmobacter aestuarii]
MLRRLPFDPVAIGLTLALGAAGGAVAHAAGLPLAYLLGSLLVVGIAAATGRTLAGRPVTLPQKFRLSFVPVIGVAIGGAFTPEVLATAPGWWQSLCALAVFLPLSHAIGYAVCRWNGIGRAEAFFGAVPGGLLESVQLGEEAGADVRTMTLLHFLRLILTIIAVPVIFLMLTGHAVGSASGVEMTGADAPLTLPAILILVVCGAAGAALARALRFPGWIITGPTLLSALAHGFGLVEGVPPGWLIAGTQIVLGTGLGARFAGLDRRTLPRIARAAILNTALSLLLAFGFALVLSRWLTEPAAAVFLAFAPGGLAEMSLIALSLNMSVAYVTTHHVVRIALSVIQARVGKSFLR